MITKTGSSVLESIGNFAIKRPYTASALNTGIGLALGEVLNHKIAKTPKMQQYYKSIGEEYDPKDNIVKARYKYYKRHPGQAAMLGAFGIGSTLGYPILWKRIAEG